MSCFVTRALGETSVNVKCMCKWSATSQFLLRYLTTQSSSTMHNVQSTMHNAQCTMHACSKHKVIKPEHSQGQGHSSTQIPQNPITSIPPRLYRNQVEKFSIGSVWVLSSYIDARIKYNSLTKLLNRQITSFQSWTQQKCKLEVEKSDYRIMHARPDVVEPSVMCAPS